MAALFHRPALVFLDEPASVLRDDFLKPVAQEGTTVFSNTQNLVEAQKMCSAVGVINQGRLLAPGPTEDVWRLTGEGRAWVRDSGFSVEVLERLKA